MKERFLYNTKTNKIHMKDYCTHARGTLPNYYLTFDTEDEAVGYGGRAAGMCKLCQKEREKRMEDR